MLVVRPAVRPAEVDAARALFREYAAGLGRDLSFQRFAEEVAELPGPYAEPEGRLLLAWVNGAVAGCVALRPLEGQACELKRLYVRPGYRGEGIGEHLVRRALDEAHAAGHRRIRLDTLPSMRAAQALYRRLGFREISPYYATPIEGTVFFERTLEPPSV